MSDFVDLKLSCESRKTRCLLKKLLGLIQNLILSFAGIRLSDGRAPGPGATNTLSFFSLSDPIIYDGSFSTPSPPPGSLAFISSVSVTLSSVNDVNTVRERFLFKCRSNCPFGDHGNKHDHINSCFANWVGCAVTWLHCCVGRAESKFSLGFNHFSHS